MKGWHAQRGFTLIEMMVAVVVFMIFIGAVYGTYRGANQAMTHTEERADTYQSGRVLLAQINRELGSLYQSASAVNSTLIGEDAQAGETESQFDTLSFATTAPRLLQSKQPAGDVRQVRYSIGSGEDDSTVGLLLEENLYPDTAVEDTTVEPVLLSDLVAGLNCVYLDSATGEWVDAWVDQAVLPAAVRVEMALKPAREGAKPIVLSTTATLTMAAERSGQPETAGPPEGTTPPGDMGGPPDSEQPDGDGPTGRSRRAGGRHAP